MVRTKDIEKEIAGFLEELAKLGFKPEKAILFGSMAKGNAHEYSDEDLAVWSKNFSNNYFLNIEKTASLKRKFKNIELHPFTENDTAENNPFIEEIEATGKIIFINR
jgi:predicted nucleotidyltransferase